MGDAAAAAPAAPPPLDGSPDLHIATSSYRLSVSNAAGYLCRITCEATFPVPPATLFRVLTNERNTGVFRDIKDVASRTVLSEGGGVRVVEVEQVGQVRLLFRTLSFVTHLRVTEDASDPARLVSAFRLLRSGVLSAFDGEWVLTPAAGDAATTTCLLTQDVTPRGVPPWLRRVPVVGGAVKGACARAVERVLADLARVADAVAAGEGVEEVLARAALAAREGKV